MFLPEPHRYLGVENIREMCPPERQRSRASANRPQSLSEKLLSGINRL